VPWKNGSPSSLLLGPLVLLGPIYSRRRRRNKWDTLLIFFALGSAIVMSLSACGPRGTPTPPVPNPTSTPDNNQPDVPPGTPTPDDPGTDPGSTPATPVSPSTPAVVPCPEPKNWLPGEFIITHYATVLESDDFFPKEAESDKKYVPFYDSPFTDTANIYY